MVHHRFEAFSETPAPAQVIDGGLPADVIHERVQVPHPFVADDPQETDERLLGGVLDRGLIGPIEELPQPVPHDRPRAGPGAFTQTNRRGNGLGRARRGPRAGHDCGPPARGLNPGVTPIAGLRWDPCDPKFTLEIASVREDDEEGLAARDRRQGLCGGTARGRSLDGALAPAWRRFYHHGRRPGSFPSRVAGAEAAGDLSPLGQEELAKADRLKVELEAHYAAGRFAEARHIVRRQLVLRRRWLGSEHELIGKCLLNLAMCTHDLGDLGGAEVLYHSSIAIYRRRLGRPIWTPPMQSIHSAR